MFFSFLGCLAKHKTPHHHCSRFGALSVAGARNVRTNGCLREKVSRTVAWQNMPTDPWRVCGTTYLGSCGINFDGLFFFFLGGGGGGRV